MREAFWSIGISFYLDAVGFVYKTNPADEARAPSAREWRRTNEGLRRGCTAKGRKEGTTQLKFLVAIAHGKGVILCKHYHGRLNGDALSRLIYKYFPSAFARSANPQAKRFLQDGDPVQNSKKAKRAIARIGARIFRIPSRSPDMNPIENIFHNTSRLLREQACLQAITAESRVDFCRRVTRTLQEYPAAQIDKTIDSMDRRMGLIIQAHGQRIRY